MFNAAGEPILLTERTGEHNEIFICRMNRPERLNAGVNLGDAWWEFRQDDSLKVMIVTGVGDRAFGVGADLRAFADQATAIGAGDASAVLAAQAAQRTPTVGGGTSMLYKPIIAAINGWCLAGSCEMAMGLDFRIIEEHARMGLPEVKRSMGAATTSRKQFWLTLMAMGREIGWTGDPLTAERALKLGYVNEIVPKGKSVERAVEIASRMAFRPVSYLHYHKERFFDSMGVPISYAYAFEQRDPPEGSGEFREGLRRSIEAGLPGWPADK